MQRRYDRLITVQRKTVTRSPSGAEIAVWTDIARRIPAYALPTGGSEQMAVEQKVARQQVTFTVRFHSIPMASRPLLPNDRIIWPLDSVPDDAQTPPPGFVHDILVADEVGRQIDLSIKTLRRADVTP